MNGFDAFISNNLGVVSSLIGVIAIAALVIAVMAYMRVLSVTRPFAWLSGQWDGDVDSLPALLQTVELNAKDVAEVRRAIDRIVEENRTHFKRIGLVRYDAFDGIAGQQSYSLCILDDNRNGYVLSNLVGRDFSRSYAIEIQKSEAPRKLGEEEGEALRLATKDEDSPPSLPKTRGVARRLMFLAHGYAGRPGIHGSGRPVSRVALARLAHIPPDVASPHWSARLGDSARPIGPSIMARRSTASLTLEHRPPWTSCL